MMGTPILLQARDGKQTHARDGKHMPTSPGARSLKGEPEGTGGFRVYRGALKLTPDGFDGPERKKARSIVGERQDNRMVGRIEGRL
jgi:hypothetical protein